MKRILILILIVSSLTGLRLTSALAQEPSAAQAPFDQGVALLSQGNYAAAADKFTEALKLNPDLPEAYINRGIARLKLDQPVEAVGDFDKALELVPNSHEALYNRALAYSQGGVYDKALEDYTRALKSAPKDWQILYNRGNTYLDLGKNKEALADYHRALKLHPQAPEILLRLLQMLRPALVGADLPHSSHHAGQQEGERPGAAATLQHAGSLPGARLQEHVAGVLGVDDGGAALDLHLQVRQGGHEDLEGMPQRREHGLPVVKLLRECDLPQVGPERKAFLMEEQEMVFRRPLQNERVAGHDALGRGGRILRHAIHYTAEAD